MTFNSSDACLPDELFPLLEYRFDFYCNGILRAEKRVTASYDVEVTVEDAVADFSVVSYLSPEPVIRPQMM